MDQDLIALAYRLRDARMWEKLADNDIYAVRLSGGGTVYCSVMGNGGQHYGLGMYVGESGWNTYLGFLDAMFITSEIEARQMMCTCINCLNCDFTPSKLVEPSAQKTAVLAYAKEHGIRNPRVIGIPDFTRYVPYMLPGPFTDEADVAIARETIAASLFLADRTAEQSCVSLGFTRGGIHPTDKGGEEIPLLVPEGESYVISRTKLPGRTPESPPHVAFDHPEMVAQLSVLPILSNLECRFIAIDVPVAPKGEPGYFPTVMLCVDGGTGMVSLTRLNKFEEGRTPQLTVDDFAGQLLESGTRPSAIYVEEDFTEAMLGDFCAKTGITLKRVSYLRNLREAWLSLFQSMQFGAGW